VLTVGIEGSYVPKDRLTATINYLTLGQSIAISATYLPGYDTPASLASVVGSYTGTAGGVGGTEVVTLDISDTGALTGVSAGGCHFTGQATPLQTINAFTVALNFGSASCVAPGQKMSGPAHFDSATQRLYMVGMLSDRSNGAVFSGTKLDHRN
jgi:hypothetical protein